ncbi:MAG: hypothetical protein JRE38_00650 [Deltaproteobacteria bacterium]|nr:hypothetical protein [Deltaproteobacteria bacterium]MBW2692342.1 hypothetical protein [Deltaproteobacteria bacterium]
MEPYPDFAARVGLALLVVLAIVALRVCKGLARFEPLVYGLAGLAGCAAFLNFGGNYHWWNQGIIARWDQYHLQLGSKYFPELGYDGLYAASLIAQEQTAPDLPIPKRVRDLTTFKLVAPENQSAELTAVRERFSDARWQSFVADHSDYLANTPPHLWRVIRLDHGYNSTPAWTFVARLFDARLPTTNATLGVFAALDLLLVVAMFALVFRTYGYRTACLCLALFGLGYGWRDIYVGSLLRLDWLAATVFGICLLKRERFAIAGACFGYAAMVRIFPVLFLTGPVLLALKAWLGGERPRWPLQLAAGFAAMVCVAFAAGSTTGQGVEAWRVFGAHIGAYRDTWSADLIGVDTLFLGGPANLLASSEERAERRTLQDVRESLAKWRPVRVAVVGVFLALAGLAMWRAPLAEAAVLGLVPFFALTPAAAYYWIVVLVVPLRRGWAAALALLLLSAAMHGIEFVDPSPIQAPWRYALLAWGYALILIAWLTPDLVRLIGQQRARAD